MVDTTNWFDITISRGPITGPLRSAVGLIVRVKADSAIEDFMRLNSKEAVHDVTAYGNSWVPLTAHQEFKAYNVPKLPPNQYSFGRYTIDSVGRPLLMSQRGLGEEGLLNLVNLSFFKIVGISKPEGVRFGVLGAYSLDYINQLNRQLLVEAKQFLLDYITPVDITLRLAKK